MDAFSEVLGGVRMKGATFFSDYSFDATRTRLADRVFAASFA